MGLFLVICSLASFGVLVHALPPIEARQDIPSVGDSCDFEGHTGVVSTTDDCQGAVSIWLYGPQAAVQCCIAASCDAQGDYTYEDYTCLNTYKQNECGQGQGKFVPGYCIGDDTVQCCVDGPLDTNSDYDRHDPSDDGSVVPTIPPADENSIEVPTIPASDEESVNPDGSITVPTIPGPPPSRRQPGNPDWHKNGWGDDFASALGITSSGPTIDGSSDNGGGHDQGSGSTSWGGYEGSSYPFVLDT